MDASREVHPPKRWSGRRLLEQALFAACGGVLLAPLDALVGDHDDVGPFYPLMVGIFSLPIVAALLGAGYWLANGILQALRERLSTRWPLLSFSEDAPRRSPIVVHAFASLVLLALAVLLPGVWLVHGGLQTVQDVLMQQVLLLLAVAVLAAIACWLAIVLFPFAQALFRVVDARFGLPWPRSTWARSLLFVVLPTLLCFVPLLVRFGDDLGPLLIPLAVVIVIECAMLVAEVVRALRDVQRLRFTVAASVCWLMLLVGGPVLLAFVPAAKAASTQGLYSPRAVWLLLQATDFDGDGFSSLYAGGDCAAFDASVHPAAHDVPGNAADENCDGVEGNLGPSGGDKGATFSNRLKPKQVRPYNIVWVIVDAIRADHMSLYGYERKTTPRLDQLAESALTFDQAYVPSTTTHLSIASMLLGKHIENVTWEYVDSKKRVQATPDHKTLPELLKTKGYRTVAIASPHMSSLPGMLRGFDHVIDLKPYRKRGGGVDGPHSTGLAIDQSHQGAPYFLLVYYEDPHKPYTKHKKPFASFGNRDIDRYDSEIAFVDHYVGDLVQHLQMHEEAWQDTIVVFSSDHGEAFGEHGTNAHGRTCYAEVAHVPLIVRVPGIKPARIESPVSLVDVMPTLLELVGVRADATDLDGRSLLLSLDEAVSETPRYCAILNQGTVSKNKPFFDRSVRFQGHHLVQKALTGEIELYDLTQDPTEKHDLAGSPAVTQTQQQLLQLLAANRRGNLFEQRMYQ